VTCSYLRNFKTNTVFLLTSVTDVVFFSIEFSYVALLENICLTSLTRLFRDKLIYYFMCTI